MSTRKRCPNGSRKNKSRVCTPVIRLADEEVDRLVKKYDLDPRARPFLKKMRLKKKLKLKYDVSDNDKTNMVRQADAVVADILKNGSTAAKRKLKKTVKKMNKPLGTAF
jgi:hypothetical protein